MTKTVEDRVALTKKFLELTLGQKLALVALVSAVAVGSFKLGEKFSAYKVEKVEAEKALLVNKLESLSASARTTAAGTTEVSAPLLEEILESLENPGVENGVEMKKSE